MKVVFWVIVGVICFIGLIYMIGLLLPKQRIVSRQSTYPVTPETLYNIVTNNDDWQYRTELKDLTIIQKNGKYEVWDEISKNGTIIRFTTKEKKKYSFYSFDMESQIFSGYWTATFEAVGNKETLFTATEYISVKNPFIKTLSYLFFDIGKLMDNYQKDLKNKVENQY